MAYQPIWGELVVIALKAEDLSFQNARNVDPFCVFRVGNVVKRTKSDQAGGLHPIWDDQVNIPVTAGQHQLFVQIFNKDNNPANLMADGVIELNKVLREKEHDGFFSLSTRGRPSSAKIYLELTFYPSQNNGAQRQPVRHQQQPAGYPPVNFRPPVSHQPPPVQQHRPPPTPPNSYPTPQQRPHPPQQVGHQPPPPMQHRPPPTPTSLPMGQHRPPPTPTSLPMGHSNIQHRPPPPIQTSYPPVQQHRPPPPHQHRPSSYGSLPDVPVAPVHFTPAMRPAPGPSHSPGRPNHSPVGPNHYPPNPMPLPSPQAPLQPLLSAPYSPAPPTSPPHGQHPYPPQQHQPPPQPQYSYPPPSSGPNGFHDPHARPAQNVMYPPSQNNTVRPQGYPPPQQNHFPRPTY